MSIDKHNITVLGIESSCDETAVAVVRNGREVLSNIISSQIDVHTIYGGVVPEIASRLHLEHINGCIRLALKEAGMTFNDIDAIAVTKGPGLVGALLIGVSAAKSLAYALGKPLIGVHHIKGHVAANYISHPDLEPPYVCLIVSGGHTHLTIAEDYNKFRLIGATVDDAAGEAFDKVARAIGLPYPGGPKVDIEGAKGRDDAIIFPKGSVKDRPYDFTFSGLKSAVLNYINEKNMKNEAINVPDLCASFEKTIASSLVSRTQMCAKEYGLKTIAMSGGVSANSYLRKAMNEAAAANGFTSLYPESIYCTDNAAMIAVSGYYEYLAGTRDDESLNAYPNLELN